MGCWLAVASTLMVWPPAQPASIRGSEAASSKNGRTAKAKFFKTALCIEFPAAGRGIFNDDTAKAARCGKVIGRKDKRGQIARNPRRMRVFLRTENCLTATPAAAIVPGFPSGWDRA